jgi:hypothetical protein
MRSAIIERLRADEFIADIEDILESLIKKIHFLHTQNNLLQKSSLREFRTFQSLSHLLLSLQKIVVTSRTLQEELKHSHWNVLFVEELFNGLFLSIHFLQSQVQLDQKNGVIALLKKFLPVSLYSHEAFIEALVYRKKFDILKGLNKEEFYLKLKKRLRTIQGLVIPPPNESIYKSEIQELHLMLVLSDQKEKELIYQNIDHLIQIPFFSINLFSQLLPLSTPSLQEKFLAERMKNWLDSFSKGLKEGNIGLVVNCVGDLANEVLDKEKITSSLPFPQKEFLKKNFHLKSHQWIKTEIPALFNDDLKRRIADLSSKTHSKLSTTLKMLFNELILYPEIGIALQTLRLLELFLEAENQFVSTKIWNEIEAVNAILKNDINLLKQILTERKLSAFHPMTNGISLLEFATELVLLGQKKSQRKLKTFDSTKKKLVTTFYYEFHALLKKELSASETNFWCKTEDIFKIVCSISNQIFLSNSGNLFYGSWDNISMSFQKLIKIYLPKKEHTCWRLHCSIIEKKNSTLKKAMKFAYNGSQKTFGLWFHLCTKAAVELIKQGNDWQKTLLFLGEMRQIIALTMRGIEFPKNGFLSYCAFKKMKPLLKTIASPGPPLNFGSLRPERDLNDQRTYYSLPKRVHYLIKIFEKIQLFEELYSEELPPLFAQNPTFGHGKAFDFGGVQFIAYPTWKKEENSTRTYEIIIPINFDNENMSATTILWNWPNALPHFSKGNAPLRLDFDFLGAWDHVSGENKKKLDNILEVLFTKLIQKKLPTDLFEPLLARFVYLFFHSQPYMRGTGAIGLILINTFLILQERTAPVAPPSGRSVDCEALIMDEKEFCKKFILWINGQNGFDF